ncbi:OadG family protein [Marinisporobacter balticus]|uniref:Sodium pump decarboxylase gamma subunit n=1 Tax=Marinisporobacter balticus TaxID=2018667 RepID=A0A4R2KG29_9FIRM|nr:OadG family protein [Marinisporobacter balticus]TCO71342.1 sodium pump decarboxylase gamma subunit [Marinisporobacter balticus]
MDKLSLLDKFKDPEIIGSLSLGDKMVASLQIMILGMGVTFVALCILWGLIVIMTKMINGTPTEATKVVKTPVEVAVPSVAVEEDNQEELVAVITAAIAASLQTSTHNIVVRNITRVIDATPTWGRTGRVEQMNSRF